MYFNGHEKSTLFFRKMWPRAKINLSEEDTDLLCQVREEDLHPHPQQLLSHQWTKNFRIYLRNGRNNTIEYPDLNISVLLASYTESQTFPLISHHMLILGYLLSIDKNQLILIISFDDN